MKAVFLAVCPPVVPDSGVPSGLGLIESIFFCVVDLFKIGFTLFGVSLSLWQVFLFNIAAGITIWVLKELFLSD